MTEEAPGAPDAILVVDDHPLFCDAISLALKSGLDLRTVETANTLAAGLDRLADGWRPDAIALDLNLPDVSGLDGLVRIKAAAPEVPVVVVSGLGDDRVVASALRAGAAGFALKESPRDAIVAAFETVFAGGVYTPPDYTPPEAAADDAPADAVDRLAELTPRQLRILSLLCEGKLNKQIAYDLSIAETTVKAHVTAILRKLGVRSRTQAVLIARRVSFAELLKA